MAHLWGGGGGFTNLGISFKGTIGAIWVYMGIYRA